MKIDDTVKLVNKGAKTFESVWDSKPIKIEKGKHIEVVRGLAEHFKVQSDKLEIEEIEKEPVKPRKTKNPLEQTDRGEAFADLKE